MQLEIFYRVAAVAVIIASLASCGSGTSSTASKTSAPPPPQTYSSPDYNVSTQTSPQMASANKGLATPTQGALSAGQIDQLTSPVALYPDPLLTNVLIASTYPLEVALAGRWVDQNKSLQGKDLDSAVNQQTWDESIKTLAYAPVTLSMMSRQIDWTTRLGEAFLAQQSDVLDSIQRLRKQAKDAGKLQSSDKQTVSTEGEYIYVEPVEDVMYVPYYDPTYAYGDWYWDDYPPYYWPAPPGYGVGAGFFLGLVVAGIWNGTINYPDHHININRPSGDRFAGRGDRGGQNWQHRPEHRRGGTYTRADLQNRYGNKAGNLASNTARRDFRGYDSGRSASRNNRTSSFEGVGRGNQTRHYSNRGYSSRSTGFGGMRAVGAGYGGMRGGGGGFRGGGGRR
jgi:hypothetical protein